MSDLNLSIGELFTETIKKDYCLKREGKDWICENGKPIKLRSPNNKSCGFSLDNSTKHPFNFVSSSLPHGIAKMCDAIIVLSNKDEDYIFIIEKKTGNKNEYKLQLINGKIFCDWIITLFEQHGHYNRQEQRKRNYIALLVWEPRKSVDKDQTTHGKGQTTHGKEDKMPEILRNHFDRFKDIQNEQQISLLDYLNT